jgi:acyl-CoA synthetase (AMP-forming)/AMP-acid ligase II
MAVSNDPERTAVVSGDVRLTAQELSDLVDGGAGVIAASGARHVVYVGAGGLLLPLLIFSSARAGVAFTPINYRLSPKGIGALIGRLPDALVIIDDRYRDTVGDIGVPAMCSDDFVAAARTAEAAHESPIPDVAGQIAVR